GEVNKPVWVGVFWDNSEEPPETLGGHIALVDGAALGRGDATATILDSPRPPGAPGVIAFLDNSQIFTMDSQGEHVTQVTHTLGVNNDQPVVSPDGRSIAFTSDRAPTGGFDIWVMGIDGS